MIRFYPASGEMTVLRSLAAFAYGKWSVSWPDAVPEDQRPSLVDDREFGFAAKLKVPRGRMGRRFVRRDVSITASGGDVPGSSDVERVLVAASASTSGDVFFERDLTREDLGGHVPYADFDVDDLVEVALWGRVVSAPVTAIEAVTAEGAVVDWRVHVGGQLVGDAVARDSATRELQAQIAQERAERLKSVGAVDAKATSAAAKAQDALDAAAVAVTSSVWEFAVSSSETVKPTSGWSAKAPTRTAGTFVWQRQVVTYGDGRRETGEAVLATGNTGATGATGADGKDGKPGVDGKPGADGISVTSVTKFWRWSESNPGTPTGTGDPAGWSTTQPAYVIGQKLWSTTRTAFSNGMATWAPTSEDASAAAATSISTAAANSRNRVWYSSGGPGSTRGTLDGDTWWQYSGDTLVGMWRWDGSKWVTQKMSDSVVANLDAGKITSGTIDAQRIAADSLTAREIKAEVFTQVGSNLLPVEPGTTNPAWAKLRYQSGTSNDPYSGFQWYSFNSSSYPPQLTNLTQVDASKEYEFSVWVSGTSGATLSVDLLDQNGANAILSGGLTDPTLFVSPQEGDGTTKTQKGTSKIIQSFKVPTSWTKYTSRVTLREGVKFIRVGTVTATGTVSVGDMRLAQYQIPQAEIDQAQDSALLALQTVQDRILEQQELQLQAIQEMQNQVVEQSKSGIEMVMASKFGSSHPTIKPEPNDGGSQDFPASSHPWMLRLPSKNTMLHVEFYSYNSAVGKPVAAEHYRDLIVPPNGTSSNLYLDNNAYIRASWSAVSKKAVAFNRSVSSTRATTQWQKVAGTEVSVTSAGTSLAAILKVVWANPNEFAWYGIRISSSKGVLKEFGQHKLGGLIGMGERTMSVMLSNGEVSPGETLFVEVKADGVSIVDNSNIKTISFRGSWLQ